MKGKIRLTIILIYNYANNTQKSNILELYEELEHILKEEWKLQSRVIILENFNINYEEYLEQQQKSLLIPWKMNLFKIVNKYKFKNTNLLFHKAPLLIW